MKFLLFILLFLFSCEKNSSSPLCCLDACDELGNVEDCAGVCGGDAVIDCEGVCEGNAIEDCIGECGGSIVWCFDADGILDNYNDYQFNGSITSIVTADNISIGNPGDILGAFVDNELRGVAIATEIPSELGEGYAFLLLAYSNQSSGESLNFKFYDSDLSLIYNIDQTVSFFSDMTEGNIISPVLLEIVN